MSWEKGRYYTRSVRVTGKIFRQYIGTGIIAEIEAARDAGRREQRKVERAAISAAKAEMDAVDAELQLWFDQIESLARAALFATGHHLHKREWRKRRVQSTSAG